MKKIYFIIILLLINSYIILNSKIINFKDVEIKKIVKSYSDGIIINNAKIYNNTNEKKVIGEIVTNSIVKINKSDVIKEDNYNIWYNINYNNISGWINGKDILPILKKLNNTIVCEEIRVKEYNTLYGEGENANIKYYRCPVVYNIEKNKIIQRMDIDYKEFGDINTWLSDVSPFTDIIDKNLILVNFSYFVSFGAPGGYRGCILYEINKDGTLTEYFSWYLLILEDSGVQIGGNIDLYKDKIHLLHGILTGNSLQTIELEYNIEKDGIKFDQNNSTINNKDKIDINKFKKSFNYLPTNIPFIYGTEDKKENVKEKILTPTVDNLRFREYPSQYGIFIRSLVKGEKLELIEKGNEETINGVKGNWVKVKTEKGEVGWTFDAYLEEVK